MNLRLLVLGIAAIAVALGGLRSLVRLVLSAESGYRQVHARLIDAEAARADLARWSRRAASLERDRPPGWERDREIALENARESRELALGHEEAAAWLEGSRLPYDLTTRRISWIDPGLVILAGLVVPALWHAARGSARRRGGDPPARPS